MNTCHTGFQHVRSTEPCLFNILRQTIKQISIILANAIDFIGILGFPTMPIYKPQPNSSPDSKLHQCFKVFLSHQKYIIKQQGHRCSIQCHIGNISHVVSMMELSIYYDVLLTESFMQKTFQSSVKLYDIAVLVFNASIRTLQIADEGHGGVL